MESKTCLYCQRLNKEIKVNQLLQNRTGRLEAIKALPCNDIGIIAVSHGIISGDTLGRNMKIPPGNPLPRAFSGLWWELVMTFRVEPGKLNFGVVFESLVGVDDISQKYQNEVARAVPWALHQGMKGWLVTDIKISLLGGEEHTMHSNPGGFLLPPPWAS